MWFRISGLAALLIGALQGIGTYIEGDAPWIFWVVWTFGMLSLALACGKLFTERTGRGASVIERIGRDFWVGPRSDARQLHPTQAPLALELLPLILIGKDDRSPILGDLHERYVGVWNYVVGRAGNTWTGRWLATAVASLSYLAMVCQVVAFVQVVDRLLKVVEAIKKTGR